MYFSLSDTTVEELCEALNNNKAESKLTSTQFECFTPECRRVVMDSLDIEPGTVVVVDDCEAMCLVTGTDKDEKAWIRFDGRTYTHEQFADTARSAQDIVRVVHYGII